MGAGEHRLCGVLFDVRAGVVELVDFLFLRIDGVDRQTVNGTVNTANIYSIRKIETTVMVPSGHTLVMGGLLKNEKTSGYSKVPILGDAPGIGALFRHKSRQRSKKNLLVFLTPTIVKDEDPYLADNPGAFLKNRAARLDGAPLVAGGGVVDVGGLTVDTPVPDAFSGLVSPSKWRSLLSLTPSLPLLLSFTPSTDEDFRELALLNALACLRVFAAPDAIASRISLCLFSGIFAI